MDVDVSRSTVSGVARAPPSKSYTHRAILAGGYAEGVVVENALISADTRATMGAVEAFGGHVTVDGSSVDIDGFAGLPAVPPDVIDCGNSGTTMRLVTGASALVDGYTVLTGDASLRSRPQGPLLSAIDDLGGWAVSTRGNGQAPLVIGGPIDGRSVTLPGDVSSQFISSLLMAGPCTEAGIAIHLSTPLKSAPYVDITLELLDAFDIIAEATDNGFRVDGGQTYVAADEQYSVPGDFSSISYLLAAGAIASEDEVIVEGAHPSAQGDSAIVDILKRMGATIKWDRSAGQIRISRSDLTGVEVDVGDTPDLLPTIAALATVAEGDTKIVNCEHVRYKETDRVAAMATELEKMGVDVKEQPDELHISGDRDTLEGTVVDGYGDHRIIMALALVGLVADGTTTIVGAEHVDVSFPDFFSVLDALGASIVE